MAAKRAKQKDVLAAVENWDDLVVQHRSWNVHPYLPLTVVESPVRWAEIQRCPCGVMRRRVLSVRTGKLLDGWRRWAPPSYAMPRGQGRIMGEARQILHMEALKIATKNSAAIQVTDVQFSEILYRQFEKAIADGKAG